MFSVYSLELHRSQRIQKSAASTSSNAQPPQRIKRTTIKSRRRTRQQEYIPHVKEVHKMEGENDFVWDWGVVGGNEGVNLRFYMRAITYKNWEVF